MLFDEAHIREDWKNFTDFAAVNQKIRRYRQWIFRFAETFHTDILDFYGEFEKIRSEEYESYFSDGVHPNRKGNERMADLILRLGM